MKNPLPIVVASLAVCVLALGAHANGAYNEAGAIAGNGSRVARGSNPEAMRAGAGAGFTGEPPASAPAVPSPGGAGNITLAPPSPDHAPVEAPPAPSSPDGEDSGIPSWAMMAGAGLLGGIQGAIAGGLWGGLAGAGLGVAAAWLVGEKQYAAAFGVALGGILGTAIAGPLGGLIGAAVLGGAGWGLEKLGVFKAIGGFFGGLF